LSDGFGLDTRRTHRSLATLRCSLCAGTSPGSVSLAPLVGGPRSEPHPAGQAIRGGVRMTNYFNAYQLKAGQTAIFPGAGDVESMTGLSYVAMGLAGKAHNLSTAPRRAHRQQCRWALCCVYPDLPVAPG